MTTLAAAILLSPPMLQLTLHPDRPRQTIHNFAASDSWTVEPLIRWPEVTRRKVADLLFDRRKGIGLSGWRFNLGGGINHETINNPLRTVDTFEVTPGRYDWNRCPGQTWMLRAAKERGVETVTAYSITAPMRLTRNGKTNGTDKLGSTNLKEGAEPEFAKYLCDIVEHFRGQGIPIDILSPINEPDFEWNAGSQEGSRASNRDIMTLTDAIHEESVRRRLPIRQLTPEATSIGICMRPNTGMTAKYGSEYGDYVGMFEREKAWRERVNPIFGYHAYWSDGWDAMVDQRQKLKTELKRLPGQVVWQTEYCQMAGPRGEGGWGRDMGMTLALNTARLIQLDMGLVETSAWQWWLAVSDSDYKDGLVYVDDLDKPDGAVFASKTLWALGNFSRFIRPGFKRIEIEGEAMDRGGILATSYLDPKRKRLVTVLVNISASSRDVSLKAPGWNQATPYITSDRPKDDLRRMSPVSMAKPFKVPSRSVVTLVADR